MCRGFNSWMTVEESKLKAIGEIVQMLHNARFSNSAPTWYILVTGFLTAYYWMTLRTVASLGEGCL